MSIVREGFRAGRLTAYEPLGRAPDGHTAWRCLCDCGRSAIRRANNLHSAKRNGALAHCGCVKIAPAQTHGHRNSPEYAAWQRIKQRCLVPTCKDFPRYGGAGVTVAVEWVNDFPAFLAHIRPMPERGMQIDRIDSRGSYVPGNVRWANRQEQARNKTNCFVWYVGHKRYETSQEIADEHGVTIQTVTRWAIGFFDKRRGTYTSPRPDVRREARYG
jgi:hypothetical protein